MGRTFALIAAIQAIFHRVLCCNKTITNALKHYETHKNMSLGFNRNFMVQTFALTAPLQPSLPQVLCGNETIPNGPKHHETHRNVSL